MDGRQASNAEIGVKYLAIGIGIGVVAGLFAGILLAPQPGEQTRAELGEAVKKASDNAKSKVAQARQKAADVLEKVSDLGSRVASCQSDGQMPAKEQECI